MACSKMEATRTSIRKIPAARTVDGSLRTRDGPVLAGGSAGREDNVEGLANS